MADMRQGEVRSGRDAEPARAPVEAETAATPGERSGTSASDAGGNGSAHSARRRDPESIGPYRVLERVGEGGMGTVYRAEQREPVRRIVAVKVVRPGLDTAEVLARFDAERQALALMNHPNVARVLDAGATDVGLPYFAMEYVSGVPLTRYCDESRLTVRQRLELFLEVCQAVQHAHQKGIIHRDLKPSNILVSQSDGGPVPKIIDFGIAKATSQALTEHTLCTRSGAMIGTPEYMSPEQASTGGVDVDTRSDIYSLGVILYELLTGSLPLDGGSLRRAGAEEMVRMIRETEPVRPSTRVGGSAPDEPAAAQRGCETRALRRQLSGDLDWIVMKCLEKSRARRYEAVTGLALDVRRHLDSEPVRARPPSTLYRLGKFARRHKGAAAAGAAAVLALLVGLAGASAGMLRARQARDNALAAQRQADAARLEADSAYRFLLALFSDYSDVKEFRQQMDAAAARLDAGWLTDQPALRAPIQARLGELYLGFSALDNTTGGKTACDLTRALARRQIEAALGLYRKLYGSNDRRVAGALAALASVHEHAGDPQAAEALYRDALVIRRGGQAAVMRRPASERLAQLRPPPGLYPAAKRRVESLQQEVAQQTLRLAGSPSDPYLYRARAVNRMRLGQFHQAANDFAKVVHLLPRDHWSWYYLACAQLYVGDESGYRQTCRHMLREFKETPVPAEADRTAKTCLLMAGAVDDLAPVEALIAKAMAPGAPPGFVPWFRMCKGILEYRRGNYAEALRWLPAGRTVYSGAGQATADSFMAMCHHRLGQRADALACLARAKAQVDRMVKPGTDDLADGAENVMMCHIAYFEATDMIMPEAATMAPR
jgi:serine/threonine protein kinase